MSAFRICRDCGHKSSLFEAQPYCCGSRDIDAVWECDECGVQAPQSTDGWGVSSKRRVCPECSPTVAKAKRVRRTKTKAATPQKGGLFE